MNWLSPRKTLVLSFETLEDRRLLSHSAPSWGGALTPGESNVPAVMGARNGGVNAGSGAAPNDSPQGSPVAQNGCGPSNVAPASAPAPRGFAAAPAYHGNVPAPALTSQDGGGSSNLTSQGAPHFGDRNAAPPVNGTSLSGNELRGPSGGSPSASLSVVMLGNQSGIGVNLGASARGGDAVLEPPGETAVSVNVDGTAHSAFQEASLATLVTLMTTTESTVGGLPRGVAVFDTLASRAIASGLSRAFPGLNELTVSAEPSLSEGATVSPPAAAGDIAPARASDELPNDLAANDLTATLPQPADLITGFLPFNAASLENAINRFLEPFDGIGTGMPELVESTSLVPASWAVAVTVLTVDVAIRIRRSRRNQNKVETDEARVRFPGLPGLGR